MSGPQLTENWNSCGHCAACCHVKQSVRWPAIWPRNCTEPVFGHWRNKVEVKWENYMMCRSRICTVHLILRHSLHPEGWIRKDVLQRMRQQERHIRITWNTYKHKTLDKLSDNGQYNKKMDLGKRGDNVNWFIPLQQNSKPSSLIIGNYLTRSIATSYLISIIDLSVDYLTMLLAAWNIQCQKVMCWEHMEPGTNHVWDWGAVPALPTVTKRKYNKYQKIQLFQLRYEPGTC